MKRAMLSLVIGLLGFVLFVTSVALAASSQPLPQRVETSSLFQESITNTDGITNTDEITDTDSMSPTTTISHPVASAIAEHFDVDYSEIAGLHEEGFGFGVIARAYFVAETLGISPTALLEEFASGTGWGVIMKEYELHPGLGRDKNLGCIMSGRCQNDQEVGSLSTSNTGHTPPGQLKKSDEANGDNRGHGGPPSTPPGHDPDKKGNKSDKGKNH